MTIFFFIISILVIRNWSALIVKGGKKDIFYHRKRMKKTSPVIQRFAWY